MGVTITKQIFKQKRKNSIVKLCCNSKIKSILRAPSLSRVLVGGAYVYHVYYSVSFSYVKDNKKLFQSSVLYAGTLQFDNAYKRLFENVFSPILMRFDVPENERQYTMAFYINGIIALIIE